MRTRGSKSNTSAIVSFLSIGLMLIAAAAVQAQTPITPPGLGTEYDPYLISELGHLVWMSDTVADSEGKYYTMTADIDASDTANWNDDGTDTAVLEGFKPIGNSDDAFTGVFDGDGHTITGLTINRPSTAYAGLFGYVGTGGQVQNLGMVGGAVTGDRKVGGLVGEIFFGIVTNCYATGSVTGNHSVGGLVGWMYGDVISNCYATGTVSGGNSVGGLVGYMWYGGVTNCYAASTVIGVNYVGGLLGASDGYGTVSNCYATGAVTGDNYVGGLAGFNDYESSVSTCYSIGTVTGIYENVGGLIGYNGAIVSNSYWDTESSGLNTSAGGTGKTTAEMRQQATFAGWNFTATWAIDEIISYPWLQIDPPPFKLTVDSVGPGSVTIDPVSPDGTYAPGTAITLTAVPDEANDELLRWLGAGPDDSLTVTVVMDTHRSVMAMFQHRIEINSLDDLAKIGNDPDYPLDNVYYILTADIDASDTANWNDDGTDTDLIEGFQPIGTSDTPFTSTFDGNGYTITDLVINRPDTSYVGLLSYVDRPGQIQDLGMVGGEVTGASAGGLIGVNDDSTVINCYSTNIVNGHTVGGLVRTNQGRVLNCNATGYVNGKGSNNGGLVGYNYGEVSDCYATAPVTGSRRIGGLIGRNVGMVTDCYATGEATGQYEVGGLVGYKDGGTVSNCYATGKVTVSYDGGGLVGSASPSTIFDSYWDIETTGQSTSSGGTGKATAEMKQLATFIGWDFASLWGVTEGVSYPWLQSSPPPFTLTVNSVGPGSVMIDPASPDGTYAPGTVVTLTAIPDGADNEFFRWVGAEPNDSPTITVVMDIHRSVVGKFLTRVEINSLADLTKIGNDPHYPLSGVRYVLTTDIDASDTANWNDDGTDTELLEGFNPIGAKSSPDTTSFRAVFDGDGHIITGLVINRPEMEDVGLFGYLGQEGQVQNLGMVDVTVTGEEDVGSLVGENHIGTVLNCYATGAVTGQDHHCGGLVGLNDGTVLHCYTTGVITGHYSVGGLVGHNNYGTVSNCYSLSEIIGHEMYVGGLVGWSAGNILHSYAAGRVWAHYYKAGGLVGLNNRNISNCYATGMVTAREDVGGLIGMNNHGTVLNCYATGAVDGGKYVGGLIGEINDGTVSNCYATGEITGTFEVGGLVGINGEGVVSSSYWDRETSGRHASDGGTGKTTAQMMQQATFVDWDFDIIWGIVENVSYPYLQNLYDPTAQPVVISAISYKTHGLVGEFGIDVLDRTDGNDIECRRYGVTKLVVGFDRYVQGVDNLDISDVSLSSGTVDAVTLTAGHILTIEMSGTTNGEPLTVTFPGIANVIDPAVICEDSLCIRQLVGDIYPDGVITALDRVKVRDAMIQAVDASNFRADVHADGTITALDRVVTRDAMSTGFVGMCP